MLRTVRNLPNQVFSESAFTSEVDMHLAGRGEQAIRLWVSTMIWLATNGYLLELRRVLFRGVSRLLLKSIFSEEVILAAEVW